MHTGIAKLNEDKKLIQLMLHASRTYVYVGIMRNNVEHTLVIIPQLATGKNTVVVRGGFPLNVIPLL